jgi:hypothetical protein
MIPTDVTFQGVEPSDALEADIHERVSWLAHVFPGILRCRVLVAVPHRHHHRGQRFHVRIELTVTGTRPIVVSREPVLHGALKEAGGEAHRKSTETRSVHRYALAALHDAFDAARRQLEDFARQQRGFVKAHQPSDGGEWEASG